MKYTLEEVKKYAGMEYDDGDVKGIINGYCTDDCEVLLMDTNKDEWRLEDSGWDMNVIIFNHWEDYKTVVWARDFDPKYVINENTNKYIYLDEKIELEVPEWWDGRPVLVYYSDESEEAAISDGDMRWLVGFTTGPEKYILSDYYIYHRNGGIEHYPTADELTKESTRNFTYIVPVSKEDLEMNPEETEDKIEIVIRRNGEEELVEISEEQLKELVGDD